MTPPGARLLARLTAQRRLPSRCMRPNFYHCLSEAPEMRPDRLRRQIQRRRARAEAPRSSQRQRATECPASETSAPTLAGWGMSNLNAVRVAQ